MSKQTGSSLISLVVALGISSALMAMLAASVARLSRTERQLNEKTSGLIIALRVERVLREIAENLDRHRFNIMPLIQHGSTPLPKPPASFDLLPSPDSDSISYVRFAVKDALKVKSCKASPNYQGVACPWAKDALPSARSFAALGLNGFYEMIGTISYLAGCAAFSLDGAPSILFDAKNDDFCDFSLLFPIEELYTFYVSRGKELRYVSHSSSQILTNQPVLSGVERIRFAAMDSGNTPRLCLKATVFFPSTAPIDVSACNSVARSASYSLLFES